jgi:hypothetical protein
LNSEKFLLQFGNMSARNSKPILSLQISDLKKHPVWQFVTDDEGDDTAVRPVGRLPVTSLMGRVVGNRVRLANGDFVWALIGNLDTKNARNNEHFVTLSIERNGNWFGLARYHDFDYRSRGPKALARLLRLSVDDIFPISYDVRRYANGAPAALTGRVMKEPRTRLTREEIIALAVASVG